MYDFFRLAYNSKFKKGIKISTPEKNFKKVKSIVQGLDLEWNRNTFVRDVLISLSTILFEG